MSTQKNSTEKDKLRPMEADGIQEFDNQLPRWWVWLFYITIVIGVVYSIRLHFFGGESLIDAFNAGQTAPTAVVDQPAQSDSVGEEQQLSLADQVALPENIAAGKIVFESTCAQCHLKDGGGLIGPNLTDNYWIHGSSPEAMKKVVSEGVPEKGMPPWLPVIGEKKIVQAIAYIITLRGTTPATPKAPQGDPE